MIFKRQTLKVPAGPFSPFQFFLEGNRVKSISDIALHFSSIISLPVLPRGEELFLLTLEAILQRIFHGMSLYPGVFKFFADVPVGDLLVSHIALHVYADK